MANVLGPEHGVDWPVIDEVAPPLRIRRLRSTKISPGSLRRENSSSRPFDPVRSPLRASSWGAEAP
jgi:hypothetical protein